MAGVRVFPSLAVFLFLLLAGFSASREERAAKNAWRQAAKHPYLALVTCGTAGAQKCAASIVSPSKVLSYCGCAGDDGTTVYAGLTAVPTRVDSTKQVRTVELVDSCPDKDNIKIYTVNETWQLTPDVAVIKIPPKGKSQKLAPNTMCNLVGFGGTDSAARVLDQPIRDCTPCEIPSDGVLCTTAAAGKLLAALDHGGPAVCNKVQYGVIHMDGKNKDNEYCNAFIDISQDRDWIDGHINPAENGTSGGTGENGNSTASSGYSIHSYLNKYSNWKVLGFLAPTIVTILQY